MSTENKGWMERAKSTAKEAMTEAGRKMNDVAERGRQNAQERWDKAHSEVVKRRDIRQEKVAKGEEGAKESWGEWLRRGISSSAETAKSIIDSAERVTTNAVVAVERFSGAIATAGEFAKEGAVSSATAVTETGKRAMEALKNTPTWALEGIKSAASRAEAARVAAAEKMKSKIDTTIDRGKALGVRIVEDVSGRIKKVTSELAAQRNAKNFESILTQEALQRAKIANLETQLNKIKEESHSRTQLLVDVLKTVDTRRLSARALEMMAYLAVSDAPEKGEE